MSETGTALPDIEQSSPAAPTGSSVDIAAPKKGFKDPTERANSVVSDELAMRYFRLLTVVGKFTLGSDDPLNEGFQVFNADGIPVMERRHPRFNSEERGLARGDLTKFASLREINTGEGLETAHVGLEVEFPVVKKDSGEPAFGAYNPGSPLDTALGEDGITRSYELYSSTIELDFGHDISIPELVKDGLLQLRAAMLILDKYGLAFVPTNLPSFTPNSEHISTHRYVRTLTDQGRGLLGKDVKDFLGHTSQVHTPRVRRLQDAAAALNDQQLVVSSLRAASAQAGSEAYEQLYPNPAQIVRERGLHLNTPHLEATMSAIDVDGRPDGANRKIQDMRNILRLVTDGGIFVTPMPETDAELYAWRNRAVSNSSEQSLGAAVSGDRPDNHKDRLRATIANGEASTIEDCNVGVFGGNMLQMAAHAALKRVLDYKLQIASFEGNRGEIYAEFPELFGPVSDETLKNGHINNMRTAMDGFDADIIGADGNIYPARYLWQRTIEFVNRPFVNADDGTVFEGLPVGVNRILELMAFDPQDSGVFNTYKDEHGLTDIRGFYETNVGNLSQWREQRKRDMINRGLVDLNSDESQKGALEALDAHTANRFRLYAEHLDEAELDRQFGVEA